jgi:Xaa-Pro aminopeptidase
MRRLLFVLLFACAGPVVAQAPRSAPPVFTQALPPEEFSARRARLLERIGDGVAILQGATEKPAEAQFRQNNQFFYLSGVEVPRALLLIDGRTRQTTLFLQDMSRRERQFGPMLYPNAEAPRLTGIQRVLPRDSFAAEVTALAGDARAIYTPHRPEVVGSGSPGEARAHANATKNDPWDGRPSREEVFIAKLRERAPGSEIRDLDPVIDTLRAIKSAREIAIIREATRITGLGIMEAMREAEPGMREYELDAAARYVFRRHGAQGDAYFALVATGTNMLYSHYHFGTAVLQDGDLVQFDYAPDYHYYVSDVTRVFPANGRFSPRQRELYTIYLRLYQAVLHSIRPYTAPRDIARAAAVKMDSIMAAFTFTDPRIRDAAERFVERYRTSRSNSLGHTIGLAVHDVRLTSDILLPGHVFTIEPSMSIPDEHFAMRLEDVILITETSAEILSDFVPVEIDDIERLMAQPGLGAAALRR